jgi:hypothetical protein
MHSTSDQSEVTWVTRTLDAEKWSAIREIGVEYDAALVVTTTRSSAQATPAADLFTIWTVSLTAHRAAILLTGANLRWLEWMRFADSSQMEPAILYDNCANCDADTYFTSFHYDFNEHAWTPRWLRGNQAAPLWSASSPAGVVLSQAYAGLSDPNGRSLVAAWSRFDYGEPKKKPEDYVFRYDLDPISGRERTSALTGKEADDLKQRICSTQGAIAGLTRGQDGPLCQQQKVEKPRFQRRPTTTPPVNNQGQSVPRQR